MKVLLLLIGLLGSAWFVFDVAAPQGAQASGEAQETFYGNGQRKTLVSYRDGRPEGPAREWYADGRPAAEGEFVAGLREGEWRFWNPDGSLDAVRSGRYRNGRKVD